MTKADERIDDLKEVVKNIDNRLNKVEENVAKTREEALMDKSYLKDLIVEAVSKGNEKILSEVNCLKIDVDTLKNAEGKRALENRKETLKTVRSVIIGVVVTFFGTILLNNAISIIAYNTTNQEVIQND